MFGRGWSQHSYSFILYVQLKAKLLVSVLNAFIQQSYIFIAEKMVSFMSIAIVYMAITQNTCTSTCTEFFSDYRGLQSQLL